MVITILMLEQNPTFVCIALGPAEVVFPAVESFRGAIKEHCGLNLRLSKCLVYTLSGEMPPGALAGMEQAGTRGEGGEWLIVDNS